MKRLLIFLAVAAFIIGFAGCKPSIYLKWGDVQYESYGEHNLKELYVTRIMPDGSTITVKVGSSDSKEYQATLEAIKIVGDAVGKIPVSK